MRLLAVLTLCLPLFASAADKPNFVLVMADDQGWGDVGFRNPDLKTPVMDELAKSSLHFTRFYAAAPVCSPTRGSVLTGRHPNRFGCFSWGHTLRPQEITVAEALKTAGYTAGHFGKWHVGPVRADSNANPGASGFDEWFSSPNFYDNHPLMSHRGNVIETHGESSLATADLAIDWMKQVADGDKPFLAVVWFGSPHGPHQALKPYADMYADLPKNKKNFYGEVTAMDEAIGRLRSSLRELDIADNTVFWYTSDNGALPVGSTGGLSGRKGRLEEGGIRVPAMIEWPARIKQPRETSRSCSTVDIYPTLLEIAGVTMPNQPVLDGESLRPIIDGIDKPRLKPMGFWVHPTRGIRTPSREFLARQLKEQQGELPVEKSADTGIIREQYPESDFPGDAAWLSGKFKLHRKVNKKGKVGYTLFDLSEDAKEQHDVADANPETFRRLQNELAVWQLSVTRSLNGQDYRAKQTK